jgi:hypothetical protein
VRGAAVLATTVAAAALVPVAGSAGADPRVAVFAGDPVGVRGKHFKPAERVTVTFAAGAALRTDPPSWRYRIVTADAAGGFVARFKEITLTRCTSFVTRARGSLGSRAFFERSVRCVAD